MVVGVPTVHLSPPNPSEERRIDWVGQRYHPQPQDPVPNHRSAITRKPTVRPTHTDDDYQMVQRQEPIPPVRKHKHRHDDDALQAVQKQKPLHL